MEQDSVTLIPIEEINILNPRVRNTLIAEGIRQNIRSVGLKRPITVTPRKDVKNGKKYDLVCGQGRLEAYIAAGEQNIFGLRERTNCCRWENRKTENLFLSLLTFLSRRRSHIIFILHLF